MSEPPAVTVIIVTYNSRSHFARQKAALAAQSTPFALIVIDNASRPDQRPTPADFPPGATVMQNDDNLGFAAANNQGVALTQTPFVALLNPDAFPEPDWLEQLLACAQRWPKAAALGSTQISADDPTRYDGLGDCYHAAGVPWRSAYGALRTQFAPIEAECFSPCAAAALYRTDVWRSLGGFDERFFCYCEDVDIGFRLRLAGHQVVQAAKAVVHHVGGASSGARPEFAVYHGTRNRLWTFVKNMPAPWLIALAPAHIAVTALFLAVSPWRGTGQATWRGVGDAVKGLGPILASRAETPRRVSLLGLARAFAWSPLAMVQRHPMLRRSRA